MTPIADRTYSSREAYEIAGITYRQLDYWARSGVLDIGPTGIGFPRRFTEAQVRELRVAAALRKAGVGLERISEALVALRADPEAELVIITGDGVVAARLESLP
jgi:DNA-binding transcriptional MerR regulator